MKKKLLMVGPGKGHNIEPWLNNLNLQEVFDVTFFCFDFKFSKHKYQHIKIIDVKYNKIGYLSLFKHALKKFDIIYINGNSGYDALIFLLFSRSKINIFNIWSENTINDFKLGTIKKRLIGKYILKRANYIYVNWYGTKEIIDTYYPQYKNKIFFNLIGYPDSYWNETKNPEDEFTRSFLSSIPNNQVVCFWPKSFIPCNRQDLVIESLNIINKNNSALLSNFTLYLWGGNVENINCRSKIELLIKTYKLEKNVQIVDHPFVPLNDILHIHKRSNFFIHIGDTDQLSSTIIEPMLMKKDIILSKIRPYILLNEIYSLDLKLIENRVSIIAETISQYLNNCNISNNEVIEKRKKILDNQEWKFSYGFNKIIENLNGLV